MSRRLKRLVTRAVARCAAQQSPSTVEESSDTNEGKQVERTLSEDDLQRIRGMIRNEIAQYGPTVIKNNLESLPTRVADRCDLGVAFTDAVFKVVDNRVPADPGPVDVPSPVNDEALNARHRAAANRARVQGEVEGETSRPIDDLVDTLQDAVDEYRGVTPVDVVELLSAIGPDGAARFIAHLIEERNRLKAELEQAESETMRDVNTSDDPTLGGG